MNHLSLFLNTRIEGSGPLAWIGDKGLAPFRYLFNGKTVCIEEQNGVKTSIHHVASFHENGHCNSSKTNWDLRSSSTGKIQTLVAVVLLIPGLVLSIFKLLAYLFSDMRQRHQLAKEHFTPINREIGSSSNPITTTKELKQALNQEYNNPLHQPTNALIIHGNGNLEINEDPGILAFNPKKLILEGARIIHRPYTLNHTLNRLDVDMGGTGKWESNPTRIVTSSNPHATFINCQEVSSVKEALAAPRRVGMSGKRYHMVFTIARPQAPALN